MIEAKYYLQSQFLNKACKSHLFLPFFRIFWLLLNLISFFGLVSFFCVTGVVKMKKMEIEEEVDLSQEVNENKTLMDEILKNTETEKEPKKTELRKLFETSLANERTNLFSFEFSQPQEVDGEENDLHTTNEENIESNAVQQEETLIPTPLDVNVNVVLKKLMKENDDYLGDKTEFALKFIESNKAFNKTWKKNKLGFMNYCKQLHNDSSRS